MSTLHSSWDSVERVKLDGECMLDLETIAEQMPTLKNVSRLTNSFSQNHLFRWHCCRFPYEQLFELAKSISYLVVRKLIITAEVPTLGSPRSSAWVQDQRYC